MTNANETVTVKMTLPAPPDGWEYTGEYREPLEGESYRGLVGGGAAISDGTIGGERLIIRKKKWYPMTGDRVWTIGVYKATGNLYVKHTTFIDSVFEKGRVGEGRYYRTEQAAQIALDRIKLVLLDAADELNNRED